MAQRKKRNISFADHVLSVFGKSPFRAFNYKQLSAQMGIRDKASKHMVISTVEKLHAEGVLVEAKRGKYKIAEKHISKYVPRQKTIVGEVDMKQTGKAYIIPKDDGDDIFVSFRNTNHALHGDIVKVALFPSRKNRKKEGEIVEIIKRRRTRFSGTLQVQRKYAFLIADNKNMPIDIYIPKEGVNKAKNGYKVIVEIVDWPETAAQPFGKVVEILGKAGQTPVEIEAILFDNELPIAFSEEVEKNAKEISSNIPDSEIKNRRDLRKITTFTIDPHDAKDFDDAISFDVLENGNYEIGVHIADVSHYVKEGSDIDREAFDRATSVYLVDRVIPMLPEILSNNLCSLRPNEEKLTYSAIFEMDKNANVHKRWFGPTVINSNRRFTYAEAQAIIEGEEGDCKDEILAVHKLAEIMRRKRFKNGAINFESQEVKFNLDKKGNPIGVYVKESMEANWLIEEFMLLANRSVAEHFGKSKKQKDSSPANKFQNSTPVMVYRVHDEPSPEKLMTFARFVSKMGYEINMQSRSMLSKSMNTLFKDISGKGEQNLIETIAVRTMTKAFYTTNNIGHYGLSFDDYTHFTSPIRRYPDLIVHRIMRRSLEGKKLPNKELIEKQCEHCSEMEKKAQEAERSSVKYMQSVYLEKHIGKHFEGHISGVSKWGIYVELKDNKCEGMIRLADMHDDFYYIDEENYRVLGQRSGTIYKIGDPVGIKIKNVDVENRHIDFVFD